MALRKTTLAYLAPAAVIAAAIVTVCGCGGSKSDTGGNGKVYETITVGGITWTNRNLSVEIDDSWCYGDKPELCDNYGRLYTWDAAKKACAGLGDGWRLPDSSDWEALILATGDWKTAGANLKALSDWVTDPDALDVKNASDALGFAALPGGFRGPGGDFFYVGYYGFWWSDAEFGEGNAYGRNMFYGSDDVSSYYYDTTYGFSVRCIRS